MFILFISNLSIKHAHKEPDLWDDDDKEVSKVPYHEESGLWDDDLSMKDDKSESKITLEQPIESHENLQISEESDEESGKFYDNDESDEKSGEFDDDDNEDNEVDLNTRYLSMLKIFVDHTRYAIREKHIHLTLNGRRHLS
ncbi:hypothetical protein RclHR1_11030009 [Rhizophagus clarus]|uniref:Uncharacterized protein n=1 Tax=Rhizophagus clarus TaxID=94130 RepID=A0A2Z6QI31_9GLOM|nr:hypothetical protein RclHR1_11030009 [Rhizophagus clarus]